jgi:hypothetical protein
MSFITGRLPPSRAMAVPEPAPKKASFLANVGIQAWAFAEISLAVWVKFPGRQADPARTKA